MDVWVLGIWNADLQQMGEYNMGIFYVAVRNMDVCSMGV